MKRQCIPTGMFGTEGHPIFLLRLWGSTGASFSILRRYITTLLERCILVFKDMLNAKLLSLQTRLRAWAMSERTREGLLRPGNWGDPPSIGRQDVDPNPVHTKTSAARGGSLSARPQRRQQQRRRAAPRLRLPPCRLCPDPPQSSSLSQPVLGSP